jgi:hypothetical protein
VLFKRSSAVVRVAVKLDEAFAKLAVVEASVSQQVFENLAILTLGIQSFNIQAGLPYNPIQIIIKGVSLELINKLLEVSLFGIGKGRVQGSLILGSEQHLKHSAGSPRGWYKLHDLARQGSMGIIFLKSLEVAFIENSDPVTLGTGSLQVAIGKSLPESLDLKFRLL